jgi:hypothetical protein
MTIKKVTIADLEGVRGGSETAKKVKIAEKKAIKDLTKDYKKDLITKNNTPRETAPVNPKGL